MTSCDFTPISLIETAPFALVVSPSLPARSVAEFIAFAKSRPGQLNYGTLGAGQIPFWAALLFNSMAGVQAQEIQYKSPAEATTGRHDLHASITGSRPWRRPSQYKDKVRVLGVTTPARVPQVPEAPAIAETLAGFQMPAWRSMMGPAGWSADVAGAEPRGRAQPRSTGDPGAHDQRRLDPWPSTPAELRKRYEEWIEIFGKIAKDTKLQPQ